MNHLPVPSGKEDKCESLPQGCCWYQICQLHSSVLSSGCFRENRVPLDVPGARTLVPAAALQENCWQRGQRGQSPAVQGLPAPGRASSQARRGPASTRSLGLLSAPKPCSKFAEIEKNGRNVVLVCLWQLLESSSEIQSCCNHCLP